MAAIALALVPLLKSVASGALSSFPGIALLVTALLLIVSVFANTGYAIEGDALRIRSGPFRWNIWIKDIVRVSGTNDPSSAPALSLERLSIEYQHGGSTREILVSPHDRSAFVAALRAVNQSIHTDVPLS